MEKYLSSLPLIGNFISQIGFPIVLCCVLIFGGWKVGAPVAEAHIQFLHETSGAIKVQADAVSAMATAIKELKSGQEETNQTLKKMFHGQEIGRENDERKRN